MLSTSPTPSVGLYGKLPSHGDFLRRRVSDGFVKVWDGWLQDCITASREALGDRWLDLYLTSPVWRFSCAAGACGPDPIIGVMVPSVDSVGRYFPLALVGDLPRGLSPAAAVTQAVSFFDAAERAVLDTLEMARIDFERFDVEVAQLADELESSISETQVVLEPCAGSVLDEDAQGPWRVPIGSTHQLGTTFQQMASERLSALYCPLALWWTDGSAAVDPTFLIESGLPAPDRFSSLLDGSWPESAWRSIPARTAAPSVRADDVVRTGPPVGFISAAASDVGRVRRVNQDAFLERPEVGVWAVADGLGGHRQGEVASRMVCDALADQWPQASFDEMIEGTRRRLEEVNAYLCPGGQDSLAEVDSGSTVVTLHTRGQEYAVLWAGDSRVYHWRAGQLIQLTRDHSMEGSGFGEHDTSVITRAVGGQPDLVVDGYSDRLEVGDRFLLCSDGLTRVVPESKIRDWMAHRDIRSAVDGLIAATLQAGAPDNVTVLIVEAFS